MLKHFAKDKKSNTDVELNPMTTSRSWAIECFLLDIYSLLSHRIKGLGWSLSDFWEVDTWTTSYLYLHECFLIEEEERELNKDKEEYHDDEHMIDLYEEMYGVES